MTTQDLSLILWWFGMLVLLGLSLFPLSASLFSSFFDRGYGFTKILALAFLSYLSFILGIFHLVTFTHLSLIIFVVLFFIFSYGISKEKYHLLLTPRFLRYVLFEEILFLAVLLFWVWVRGFNPEIHGLEKYMDFGFINSILRSEYFPPKDMWFSPFPINYYYFGHLYSAVLTKLSGLPSNITYNLLVGTIAALCMTASFSLVANLLVPHVTRLKRMGLKIVIGGLLAASLVTFGGNLHTIYTVFRAYPNERPLPPWELQFSVINPCFNKEAYTQQNIDEKTGKKTLQEIICPQEQQDILSFTYPNNYWYPNATRFIFNTIHEFPIYSWVVSDLHGHVLDIPFVLLTIALLYSYFSYSTRLGGVTQSSKFKTQNSNSKLKTFFSHSFKFYDLSFTILLGLILAIMYMTNAWDGLIYLLLTGFVVILISLQKNGSKLLRIISIDSLFFIGSRTMTVFICFILFSLPFSLFFKPFVSGIGVLCAPDFLTKIGHFGPFLFEADHCQHSPWWQLLILYGFFMFTTLSFLVYIRNKQKTVSDIFVLILITLSFLLILIPEFIYIKDIYPAHYRANTMFKLVFQAFIMLSLTSGYSILRITTTTKNKLVKIAFLLITFPLLLLIFTYPYFAITSYYNNLEKYQSMDGTSYLQTLHPDDYQTIQWINKNITGQPILLEAQGDSYTDYARISSNTGLPTPLGWTVHEWLWRGTYDIPAPRITDVQTLYESADINQTKQLVKKYAITYVYISDLEREKYPGLIEDKWQQLGKIIFQTGQTKLYSLE